MQETQLDVSDDPAAVLMRSRRDIQLTSTVEEYVVILMLPKRHRTSLLAEVATEEKREQEQFIKGLEEQMERPCNITLTVVGHQGVGKSCLVKQLQRESIPAGRPGSTDTAEFYAHYMGFNPNTGYRQKLDQNGEIECGRRRLNRIIHRYQRGLEDGEARGIESKQDRHDNKQTTDPSSTATPEPSAASASVPSPAKMSEFQTRNPSLSLEQKAVIEEVMRPEEKETGEVKGFVTIYDFGGEKVFYNTHHCFLSSNMVFILVFDVAMCLDPHKSKEGYEITEFWLMSIATYAVDKDSRGNGTPPIILVGSHMDRVSDDKEEQNKAFLTVINKLRGKPEIRHIMEKHVQEMFHIANLNDDSQNKEIYDLIWKTLMKVAPLQSRWELPVPARWLALEHALVRCKKAGSIVLTYEELMDVNKNLAVPIPTHAIMDFLKYLKLDGCFLCFDLHTKRPFIVLQPQWIIDAFKAIITAPTFAANLPISMRLQWEDYEKSGLLKLSFIKQLWAEKFHENEDKLYIAMETICLLAKPLTDVPNDDVDYFIVPSMLQPATPEKIIPVLEEPNTVSTVTLCLKFDNQFIPPAVWDKFLAACIHRFQRLNEPGHADLNVLQRGFACLSMNFMWNMVIHCHRNAMKIKLFKRATTNVQPAGAGVIIVGILEYLLQQVLESSHQDHLRYQFYLHDNHLFTPDDKMARVEDLRLTTQLPCYGSKGHGFIEREDILDWFKHSTLEPEKQIPSGSCVKINDLDDRKPTIKEIGRVSKYIGKSYQTFFVGLGCPIELLEQEMEEHRHLTFRSCLTKIFLQLRNMKVDISFGNLAEAMSKNGMNPSQLQHVLDDNRNKEFKDETLSRSSLQKSLTGTDVDLIENHSNFKPYFNFFLEMGFSPKSIDEFDYHYRNKKHREKIKAMLMALIDEIQPRPNWNTLLLAMEECNMDTESLLEALKSK
ncbi:uncharacterized protein LOC132563880 [Ylistrum balloti]|uniref:uncharacterized protein LOC132563880 n=1 Tax=Ylistrum balloti TaxID=509963 RepID=UPI002905BDB0|nr:uncharacterized protein LOC132563880 [Ylistrum balloti]